jgi:hypothetical protein
MAFERRKDQMLAVSESRLAWEIVRHVPGLYESHLRDLRTVCTIVGPYRNLTTLLASALALHPECQVLNHAEARVLPTRTLDFLTRSDPQNIDRFARFACYASARGRRGDHGGSVLFSHAFDSGTLRAAYEQRYDSVRVKPRIVSLVWKADLPAANALRRREDLRSMFAADGGRLRFLFPQRNPIECAKSNLKTGHWRRFENVEQTLESVLAKVLDEHAWFTAVAARFPERCRTFRQSAFADPMEWRNLAAFLGLSADAQWEADVVRVASVRPDQPATEEERRVLARLLESRPALSFESAVRPT